MDILDVEGEPGLARPETFFLPVPGLTRHPWRQAENADDWSYQKGLEGGWIPKDPTDRLYPNICSGS